MPDTMLIHVFASTRDVVHGLVDSFALEGAAVRVDASEKSLVLRASVPLRGDSADVAMRFRLVGKPEIEHHCVSAEPSSRLGHAGSRIELAVLLRRVASALTTGRGLAAHVEKPEDSEFGPALVPPMPDLGGGFVAEFRPVGGGDGPGGGLPAATALLQDATDAELAAFARSGPGPGAQSTGAAVLDVMADSAAPKGAVPALARRTVEAAGTIAHRSSDSGSVSSPGHTDKAPTEAEIRGAVPGRPPATEAAVKQPRAGVPGRAGDASPGAPFAASSEHIRACLGTRDGQSHGPAAGDEELAAALAPLAAAMASSSDAARRHAVTTAARLIVAQRGPADGDRVRRAMGRAGVSRAVGALLVDAATAHAAAQHAAGGREATRRPDVAAAVVAKAAASLGFAAADLTAALRAALVIGAPMDELCPAAGDLAAVREAVAAWAALPDGDSACLVQLQRTATEVMDLNDEDDE